MRFHDVIKSINKSNKIAITYHVSPDGDALGSALALLQGIRNYGKEAYVVSKDSVADNLSFLPYAEEITGELVNLEKNTDCVIVVDCGNIERISANIEGYKGLLINIDHHLSNDKYGTINCIDSTAAATAEIIYEILIELGVGCNDNIGQCIYTALITDTGSFRYSNATNRTHVIAGQLIENGVNHEKIHRSVFDNKSYDKLKLMGLVLDDMELICNGKIIFMSVTKEMLKCVGLEAADSSDIVSLGNQVKGIEGSIVVKEADDGVKLSLRSKNELDVRKIAEMLGGGGHTKASGAFLRGKTLSETKKIIINLLEKELI